MGPWDNHRVSKAGSVGGQGSSAVFLWNYTQRFNKINKPSILRGFLHHISPTWNISIGNWHAPGSSQIDPNHDMVKDTFKKAHHLKRNEYESKISFHPLKNLWYSSCSTAYCVFTCCLATFSKTTRDIGLQETEWCPSRQAFSTWVFNTVAGSNQPTAVENGGFTKRIQKLTAKESMIKVCEGYSLGQKIWKTFVNQWWL